MKRAILTAALFTACMAFAASADIPQSLNYQGVLTDASGVAVPDGSYSIEFNIYNIASGGTALWTETNTVQVTKGIFSVVLGTLTSLNLAFDEPYWLGMAVEGESELIPRVTLNATAYSLNSQGVTGTDNVFPPSGYVGIGTTSPTHVLTIEGDPSAQVALQLNGNNSSWNSLYVNSANPLGKPGYGYQRSGGIRAHTYLDANDSWKLQLGAVNALTVLPSGNVGIGIFIPYERLEVDGAMRIGSAAGTWAGTIQWTGSDFEGYDGSAWRSLTGGAGGSLPVGTTGQTLRHNGADWEASSVLYNSGPQVGIGTTTPAKMLDVAGSIRAADTLFAPVVDVGSWDAYGRLRLLRSGMSGGSVALDAQAITDGVYMRFLDAEGDATHYFNADGNGEGGYFSIMRNGSGNPGLVVDGNRGGTLSTAVTIYGTSRSAAFDMSSSGDDCAVLPPDAISSSEILNEAGGGGVNSLDFSGIALTPAVYDVLASRSITVPTAGYVLVTSACQLTIDHVSTSMSYGDVGVSDVNNSFATSTDMTVAIADAAPTGRYIIPASSTALFTVSAGTHTFYMLGRGGNGTVTAYDVNLAAVFIPTAYGTVSPTLTSTSDGIEEGTTRAMSSSDIAAERSESIDFNEARIEREIAEMRARLAELEKAVENK